MNKTEIVMDGVIEYNESYPVRMVTTIDRYGSRDIRAEWDGVGRIVVQAKNEGGHNCTDVDLRQLLSWVAANKPDLYMYPVTPAMMEASAYWRTPVHKRG